MKKSYLFNQNFKHLNYGLKWYPFLIFWEEILESIESKVLTWLSKSFPHLPQTQHTERGTAATGDGSTWGPQGVALSSETLLTWLLKYLSSWSKLSCSLMMIFGCANCIGVGDKVSCVVVWIGVPDLGVKAALVLGMEMISTTHVDSGNAGNQ